MREHLAAGPTQLLCSCDLCRSARLSLVKILHLCVWFSFGPTRRASRWILTAQTESGYRSYTPYVDLAAAYALEGKMEEAKSSLAEARRINSRLTVKWTVAHSPNLPRALEGVRKAGLPEE